MRREHVVRPGMSGSRSLPAMPDPGGRYRGTLAALPLGIVRILRARRDLARAGRPRPSHVPVCPAPAAGRSASSAPRESTSSSCSTASVAPARSASLYSYSRRRAQRTAPGPAEPVDPALWSPSVLVYVVVFGDRRQLSTSHLPAAARSHGHAALGARRARLIRALDNLPFLSFCCCSGVAGLVYRASVALSAAERPRASAHGFVVAMA